MEENCTSSTEIQQALDVSAPLQLLLKANCGVSGTSQSIISWCCFTSKCISLPQLPTPLELSPGIICKSCCLCRRLQFLNANSGMTMTMMWHGDCARLLLKKTAGPFLTMLHHRYFQTQIGLKCLFWHSHGNSSILTSLSAMCDIVLTALCWCLYL